MLDRDLNMKIARLLYDRKAQDIVLLNVGHLTVLCDYLLIATGRTANQVTALADAVDDLMADEGIQLRVGSQPSNRLNMVFARSPIHVSFILLRISV